MPIEIGITLYRKMLFMRSPDGNQDFLFACKTDKYNLILTLFYLADHACAGTGN